MAPAFIDQGSQPTRRSLLAGGATLVGASSVAWAGSTRCSSLAIGYCAASEIGALHQAPIVPAHRLIAGAPELADREVRVTLQGLLGNSDRLASLGVRSAELRIGFSVAHKSDPIEFRAWNYRLVPESQYSPPLAFTVPIDRELPLSLEVEHLGFERFKTVLSTNSEPGVAKLRTGSYLIAPGASDFRSRNFDPARSEPVIAMTIEEA